MFDRCRRKPSKRSDTNVIVLARLLLVSRLLCRADVCSSQGYTLTGAKEEALISCGVSYASNDETYYHFGRAVSGPAEYFLQTYSTSLVVTRRCEVSGCLRWKSADEPVQDVRTWGYKLQYSIQMT